MAIIALILSAVLPVILFIWPRSVPLLLWPVLLLYPHGLWDQISPFPEFFNIGYDDLFVIMCAVVVVFRLGGQGMPTSWSFKAVVAFFIINMAANLFGMLTYGTGGLLLMNQTRSILKMGIVVLLVYALLTTIRTQGDFWRTIKVIVLTITAAGVVMMLSWPFPQIAEFYGGDVAALQYEQRAAGPLISPNTAAVVLMMGLCLVIMMVEYVPNPATKLIYAAAGIVMAIGVFLARSRTGFAILATLPFFLLLMRGLRKWAIAYLVGALLVPLLAPEAIEGTFRRIAIAGTQGGGMASRFRIWHDYLGSMDLWAVLLGQGSALAQGRTDIQVYPHNGILNLFCFYGIWGLVWGGAVYTVFIAQLRRLGRIGYPEGAVWLKAGVLFTMAVAIATIFTDTFYPGGYMLLVQFGFFALTDRLCTLLSQESAYAQYYYAAQMQQYYDATVPQPSYDAPPAQTGDAAGQA